ncbi:chloride channel protein [Candidatus Halobeggiatoa sp. HSG11]|nr:chloride channel protein [Candidatus Halobeggiatoa sp. HSG11]
MRLPTPIRFSIRSLRNISVLTFLTVVIGISTGLGAVLLEQIFYSLNEILFIHKLWGTLNSITPYQLILIPAIGGLVVGAIVFFLANETKGRTVPDVLTGLVVDGEDLPPRALAIKSIAAAICAGIGGSVGLGGPTAQIGAAVSITIGKWLRLNKDKLHLLIMCGISGGIAAAFNAPLMGTFFVLEIILGGFKATDFIVKVILNHFKTAYFILIFIAAVVGDYVSQSFRDSLLFVPEHYLMSYWESLLYILLGVVIAFGTITFNHLMVNMKKFWDNLPISEHIKPVIGLSLLGIIGFFSFDMYGFPHFFGLGNLTIMDAFNGSLALVIIFALIFLKMLATSITIGSGCSGGTITPSFFIGAMLGGTFGLLVNSIFPATAPSGAYAMVGMAAFFGGVFNAPFTAIMVGIEIIGHNDIVWPILLTVLVSHTVTTYLKSPKLPGLL